MEVEWRGKYDILKSTWRGSPQMGLHRTNTKLRSHHVLELRRFFVSGIKQNCLP